MCLIDEKEAIYECDNNCNGLISYDESRKCYACDNDLCIDCYTENPLCEICQQLESEAVSDIMEGSNLKTLNIFT